MQKRITEFLDVSIPGEFAKGAVTRVRRADEYVVNTAVDYGKVAAVKGGEVAPVGTSDFTAVAGIVMSTHQGVSRGTIDGALVPTMKAKAGDVVDVCTIGDVYVELPLAITASAVSGKDTEAEAVAAAKSALDAAAKTAIAAIVRGTQIYYSNANGAITTNSSSATALGKVCVENNNMPELTYTVAAAKDDSSQKWGVASPAASGSIVIGITLG